MGKRTYYLEVAVDADAPARTSNLMKVGADRYVANIRHNAHQPDLPLEDILAHELGHFIADILETPRSRDDPRTRRDVRLPLGWVDQEMERQTYEAEQEAWELAAKMRPGGLGAGWRELLATYEPK
jgi:hypothetical protein